MMMPSTRKQESVHYRIGWSQGPEATIEISKGTDDSKKSSKKTQKICVFGRYSLRQQQW
jgi:hypothetical protein